MHTELGGYGGPGAIVVTRFPSVIVPVCVVKGASAAGVLKLAPCVTETPCVEETPEYERDPVCEWCGCECAGVRASQQPVYE